MNRSSLVLPLVALVLSCVSAGAAAQGVYYKCVDDRGNVTFANTGDTKGCTKHNADPVVIPKFQAPGGKAASTTDPSFPKVDGTVQRQRDNDRRRILEDELRDKEARLAGLKREYNNGEPERQGNERNYQKYLDRVEQMKGDIARAESDIASIKAEISKVQ